MSPHPATCSRFSERYATARSEQQWKSIRKAFRLHDASCSCCSTASTSSGPTGRFRDALAEGSGARRRLDRRGAVGDQGLERLENGIDGEHGVSPHKRVPVLEVVLDGRDQRLEDLYLGRRLADAFRADASRAVAWTRPHWRSAAGRGSW